MVEESLDSRGNLRGLSIIHGGKDPNRFGKRHGGDPHPSFGPAVTLPEAPAGSALAALVANLLDQQAINAREERTVAEIVTAVAPAPVVRVPLLDIDVHDLNGLGVVANHIFGHEQAVVAGAGAGLA